MSNKQIGSSFEQELCEMLSQYGFWAHNLKANNSGQPADIIAAKNERAYLIDAKVCETDSFSLSRIEENQELAMTLWEDCGNDVGWFAFKIGDEVYMLPHGYIKTERLSGAAMSVSRIAAVGIPFHRWCVYADQHQ